MYQENANSWYITSFDMEVEAAGTPGPTEGSGRYAPNRGCLSEAKTGVKIVAKKKPGDEPGEFFACYKRNKFIC